MAEGVSLDELIASLTSAVANAQDAVHRHQLALVGSYFDSEGRPLSFHMKLPSTAARAAPHDYRRVTVPLVARVEPNMLSIAEFSVNCTVQLDTLVARPALAPASDVSATPPSGPTWRGAPVDVPAIGEDPAAAAAPSEAGAGAAGPAPAAAAVMMTDPPAPLSVGLAPAESRGAIAHLSIKVQSQPPAEALRRLIDALNKTI